LTSYLVDYDTYLVAYVGAVPTAVTRSPDLDHNTQGKKRANLENAARGDKQAFQAFARAGGEFRFAPRRPSREGPLDSWRANSS
jgi:hypothetical protein